MREELESNLVKLDVVLVCGEAEVVGKWGNGWECVEKVRTDGMCEVNRRILSETVYEDPV